MRSPFPRISSQPQPCPANSGHTTTPTSSPRPPTTTSGSSAGIMSSRTVGSYRKMLLVSAPSPSQASERGALGLPPFMRRSGPLEMCAVTESKRKFPGFEDSMSLRESPPVGKRSIQGKNSEVCTGLGQNLGSVRMVIDPITQEPRRNQRSKEFGMSALTGTVRKCE